VKRMNGMAPDSSTMGAIRMMKTLEVGMANSKYVMVAIPASLLILLVTQCCSSAVAAAARREDAQMVLDHILRSCGAAGSLEGCQTTVGIRSPDDAEGIHGWLTGLEQDLGAYRDLSIERASESFRIVAFKMRKSDGALRPGFQKFILEGSVCADYESDDERYRFVFEMTRPMMFRSAAPWTIEHLEWTGTCS